MCNNCDQCNNCDPCNNCNNCEPVTCGCKIVLDTICVQYTGNNIDPAGITAGQNLTEILQNISTYLSFLLTEIENKSAIENVGGGVESYIGRNPVTDANQLRTFIDTDSIKVTQNAETIEFNVDDVWLQSQIVAPDLSTLLTNIGGGIEIYSGYNGGTTQHELKTLTSSDASVSIVDNGTEIDITKDDSGVVESVGTGLSIYAGFSGTAHQIKSINENASPTTGGIPSLLPLEENATEILQKPIRKDGNGLIQVSEKSGMIVIGEIVNKYSIKFDLDRRSGTAVLSNVEIESGDTLSIIVDAGDEVVLEYVDPAYSSSNPDDAREDSLRMPIHNFYNVNDDDSVYNTIKGVNLSDYQEPSATERRFKIYIKYNTAVPASDPDAIHGNIEITRI